MKSFASRKRTHFSSISFPSKRIRSIKMKQADWERLHETLRLSKKKKKKKKNQGEKRKKER